MTVLHFIINYTYSKNHMNRGLAIQNASQSKLEMSDRALHSCHTMRYDFVRFEQFYRCPPFWSSRRPVRRVSFRFFSLRCVCCFSLARNRLWSEPSLFVGHCCSMLVYFLHLLVWPPFISGIHGSVGCERLVPSALRLVEMPFCLLFFPLPLFASIIEGSAGEGRSVFRSFIVDSPSLWQRILWSPFPFANVMVFVDLHLFF